MSPTSFAPGGGVSLQTLGDGKGGQDQATIFASKQINKNIIKIQKPKHNHLIHCKHNRYTIPVPLFTTFLSQFTRSVPNLEP